MDCIPSSDSSLLVTFGDEISGALHRRVLSLFRSLQSSGNARIRNLHPGYASLLIDFDPLQLTHDELADQVRGLALTSQAASSDGGRVAIPVCYDPEFGPDLAQVARQTSLSLEQVIRLHSSVEYLVYFLGFTPGFAYLGGLPPEIQVPRLATPRFSVPAGSVGIAGRQTGVYPLASPGGWQLIGRTPLSMFDSRSDTPARLQPGDRVRFYPISRDEFARSL